MSDRYSSCHERSGSDEVFRISVLGTVEIRYVGGMC
jgi:hypothetical protein